MTVGNGNVGNRNKRKNRGARNENYKTFSSIHMFRQQEATYRTELWSVKHNR